MLLLMECLFRYFRNIKYVNERACCLVGMSTEQIIGKSIQSLLKTDRPIKASILGS